MLTGIYNQERRDGQGLRYVWVRTEIHAWFWLQILKYKYTLYLI
jgi:hypothetical protein